MSGSLARIVAPAKLNLRLLVGPLGEDGYHPLESLMVALDGLDDTVTVERASRRRVICAGVAERENLAWAALDVLERHTGQTLPCAVTIDKRIPAQAGLGGGSSDAAATLLGANRVFGLGLGADELETLAARVGSDVPFFIRAGAQWARGRGELLSPAQAPPFAALIIKPRVDLSTPRVYRAFDDLPAPPPAQAAPVPTDFAGLTRWARNDLWPAACSCAPELDGVARSLAERTGAPAVLLCGSGSALAALFPDRDAAQAAAARVPETIAVVTPRAV